MFSAKCVFAAFRTKFLSKTRQRTLDFYREIHEKWCQYKNNSLQENNTIDKYFEKDYNKLIKCILGYCPLMQITDEISYFI